MRTSRPYRREESTRIWWLINSLNWPSSDKYSQQRLPIGHCVHARQSPTSDQQPKYLKYPYSNPDNESKKHHNRQINPEHPIKSLLNGLPRAKPRLETTINNHHRLMETIITNIENGWNKYQCTKQYSIHLCKLSQT